MRLLINLFIFIILSTPSWAAIYYVRTDGGTPSVCTGTTDAADSWGTGSGHPCAWNHPNWAIPANGQPTTYRISGGDTLVIGAGSYKMGCQNSSNCVDATKNYTTGSCASTWTYDCGGHVVPNGTSVGHTKIVGCTINGCGSSTRPQLYLVGRMNQLFTVTNSAYIDFKDVEITDHWGADGECSASYNQECGRNAFVGYGGWHDLYFYGVDIHGLTGRGFLLGGSGAASGISGVGLYLEHVNIDGNKQAGLDMDTCSNNGSCGIRSGISMTFKHTTMRWNGCSEAYPVNDGGGDIGRYPTTLSCREGNNGGYGDMIGTSDTGGDWIFEDSNLSHNSSDGIDLLYCGKIGTYDYGGCTISVKRCLLEGNNGQQIKIPSNAYVEDSLIIGNCSYFGVNPESFAASGFVPCRATGSPISISFLNGTTSKFYNNTITGTGDVLVSYASIGGSACTLDFKNNIMIGGWDWWGIDEMAMYYQETCPVDTINEDYNLCYGTFKAGYSHCSNTHDKSSDPLMTGIIENGDGPGFTGYYTGADYATHFGIQTGSPAIASADASLSGADSLDYNRVNRGSSWALGALEYNSTQSCIVDSDTCYYSSECCSGYCNNNYQCYTPGSYLYNITPTGSIKFQ